MRDRPVALTLSALSTMAALAALACAAATGCSAGSASPSPASPASAPAAGQGSLARLPDIAVTDLDRAPKSVEALRAGRVALVTFWATWCDSCEKEQPALNRLDAKVTGDQAVVIGVAVGEPPATVRGFVQQHGLRYAQLVDEGFLLTDALGQKRLPATVIVNRAGEVVYTGAALDADALAALRKALAE